MEGSGLRESKSGYRRISAFGGSVTQSRSRGKRSRNEIMRGHTIGLSGEIGPLPPDAFNSIAMIAAAAEAAAPAPVPSGGGSTPALIQTISSRLATS
ncbi:hypothetical protein MPTK1_6g16210 [Marchantia polymorpha subsp. ruderalis]|uniref:Uncharacterized protein n=2 Tax=Marchantia polymorpha TaxID=3197 RepID=A0AAF6BSM0_MARPO|nr:hypothetical protein MARPO_0056s0131 [Marchantia polymorpha]BBN15004.1 hypothetical protein Mp_6g16210 [Marchantia polymorpha subsp. ruderalis]|eukprot:PTQ37688.1 hypothetical protein MARPO_0056s0131 [Marchantia polymorpha]